MKTDNILKRSNLRINPFFTLTWVNFNVFAVLQVVGAVPVLLCCLGQVLGQAVPGLEAWQAAIQAHAQVGHI
jgi:hypothetical protein